MPTYDSLERFLRDYGKLTLEQRDSFRNALAEFVDDLKSNRPFRKGLRVKRVQGTADIWEMTWANDGRATWQYGPEILPGEAHVIWRRIGTHSIFDRP